MLDWTFRRWILVRSRLLRWLGIWATFCRAFSFTQLSDVTFSFYHLCTLIFRKALFELINCLSLSEHLLKFFFSVLINLVRLIPQGWYLLMDSCHSQFWVFPKLEHQFRVVLHLPEDGAFDFLAGFLSKTSSCSFFVAIGLFSVL